VSACGRGQTHTQTAHDHNTFCVIYDSHEMLLNVTCKDICTKWRINIKSDIFNVYTIQQDRTLKVHNVQAECQYDRHTKNEKLQLK